MNRLWSGKKKTSFTEKNNCLTALPDLGHVIQLSLLTLVRSLTPSTVLHLQRLKIAESSASMCTSPVSKEESHCFPSLLVTPMKAIQVKVKKEATTALLVAPHNKWQKDPNHRVVRNMTSIVMETDQKPWQMLLQKRNKVNFMTTMIDLFPPVSHQSCQASPYLVKRTGPSQSMKIKLYSASRNPNFDTLGSPQTRTLLKLRTKMIFLKISVMPMLQEKGPGLAESLSSLRLF